MVYLEHTAVGSLEIYLTNSSKDRIQEKEVHTDLSKAEVSLGEQLIFNISSKRTTQAASLRILVLLKVDKVTRLIEEFPVKGKGTFYTKNPIQFTKVLLKGANNEVTACSLRVSASCEQNRLNPKTQTDHIDSTYATSETSNIKR